MFGHNQSNSKWFQCQPFTCYDRLVFLCWFEVYSIDGSLEWVVMFLKAWTSTHLSLKFNWFLCKWLYIRALHLVPMGVHLVGGWVGRPNGHPWEPNTEPYYIYWFSLFIVWGQRKFQEQVILLVVCKILDPRRLHEGWVQGMKHEFWHYYGITLLQHLGGSRSGKFLL